MISLYLSSIVLGVCLILACLVLDERNEQLGHSHIAALWVRFDDRYKLVVALAGKAWAFAQLDVKRTLGYLFMPGWWMMALPFALAALQGLAILFGVLVVVLAHAAFDSLFPSVRSPIVAASLGGFAYFSLHLYMLRRRAAWDPFAIVFGCLLFFGEIYFSSWLLTQGMVCQSDTGPWSCASLTPYFAWSAALGLLVITAISLLTLRSAFHDFNAPPIKRVIYGLALYLLSLTLAGLPILTVFNLERVPASFSILFFHGMLNEVTRFAHLGLVLLVASYVVFPLFMSILRLVAFIVGRGLYNAERHQLLAQKKYFWSVGSALLFFGVHGVTRSLGHA